MTNQEFYKMFEKMIAQEKEIMIGKGKEYTVGSDDKLENFKLTGKNCGVDPLKVWFIFAAKHWASICNYVKDGVEASNEPIDGRFMDLRNYLALGIALIQEQKENETADEIPFQRSHKMKLYFTNQLADHENAREKELRIEHETGLELDNPFHDGDAKEIKQLMATGQSDLTSDEIVGRDLKRIKEADGLLAYVSNDKNIGSCMEIAIASFSWGKPVYCICPDAHIRNHPWIVYFANRVFKSDYEFIKYARETFPECKKN